MKERTRASDVLLVEYATLREETLMRSRSRFAIAGLLGAVMAFAFTSPGIAPSARWAVALSAAAVLLAVWLRLGWNLRVLAERLAEIEKAVNTFEGAELLVWHRRYAPNTLFGRFYRLRNDERKVDSHREK